MNNFIFLFFRLDRHDYDTSLLDSNVPPRFTLPLIDQVKKVRETVELTVTGESRVVGSGNINNYCERVRINLSYNERIQSLYNMWCWFSVTCRPEPEVQWFHKNVRIKSSKHYDLEHIKGVYRLIIHEVNPDDAGTWKCEATNKYGHTWCSCELKVIGKGTWGWGWRVVKE